MQAKYQKGQKIYLGDKRVDGDNFTEYTIIERCFFKGRPAYYVKEEGYDELELFSEGFIDQNFLTRKNFGRDLRMYILVNEDLKMSKGKVAAQVGHAVNILTYQLMCGKPHEVALMHEYMDGEIKKIILSAPQEVLEELENEGYTTVRDKGYTEIEPNSLTCVNLGILDKQLIIPDLFINKLKLYK